MTATQTLFKVSAIVSAYYCDKWLKGRIDNLLDQDIKPEVIVIAQGESKEMEIARTYPELVLIGTKLVPPVYEAWNMGIRIARGEYITNANADDRLYPGALSRMVEALDQAPRRVALAYGNVDIVQEPGGEPYSRYNWAQGGLHELLQGCFIGPMPVWRKEIHENIGYFDEAYHSSGDYEFWMRMAKNRYQFIKMEEEPVGAYTKRKGSIEHREPIRTLWETARARATYDGTPWPLNGKGA